MTEVQSADPQWWARVVELYDDDDAASLDRSAPRVPSSVGVEGLARRRQHRSWLRIAAAASLVVLPLVGVWLEDTLFPAVGLAAMLFVPTWLAMLVGQRRRRQVLDATESLDTQASLRVRARVLRRARAHWRLTFVVMLLVSVGAASAGAWSFVFPVASMALITHLPWLLCSLPALVLTILSGRQSVALGDELRALDELADELELSVAPDAVELERNWTQVIVLAVILGASLATAFASALLPQDWTTALFGHDRDQHRVLVVSDTVHDHSRWLASFQFEVDQLTLAEIDERATAIFGERGTPIERALGYASYTGYGHVLYDLDTVDMGDEVLDPTRFDAPWCPGYSWRERDPLRASADRFAGYTIEWLGAGCYLTYGASTPAPGADSLVNERSALGHALFNSAVIRPGASSRKDRWAVGYFDALDTRLATGTIGPEWTSDDAGFKSD